MKQPEFTSRERYLIDYYRNQPPRLWWGSTMYDAYFLVPAVVLFVFGLQDDDPSAMILGFGLLVFHLLLQSVRAAKWGNVLASIVRKYDCALNAFQQPSAENCKSP
jgi:hypothetical protein